MVVVKRGLENWLYSVRTGEIIVRKKLKRLSKAGGNKRVCPHLGLDQSIMHHDR